MTGQRSQPLHEDEHHYLFVYGTLRYGAEGKMPRLLSGSADFVCEAQFQGKLYRIDYYPGVIPSSCSQDQVVGDVFLLRDPATLLPHLDEYEGIGPPPDHPNDYERRLMPVKRSDGQILQCWIYLYLYPLEGCERIPDGDFLASIAKKQKEIS